jgi:hypothetical protein
LRGHLVTAAGKLLPGCVKADHTKMTCVRIAAPFWRAAIVYIATQDSRTALRAWE